MKAWWGKHWETATLVLCFMAMLAVVGVCVWEWIVDMNGIR